MENYRPKDITTKEYVDGQIPTNDDFCLSGLSDTIITTPSKAKNYNIIEINGLMQIQSFSQQQANWNETSTSSVQYIQNKPNSLLLMVVQPQMQDLLESD